MAHDDDGSGRLTTHILDTASGRPAEGVAIELFRLSGGHRERIASMRTNADGRCDVPLLSGPAFRKGAYELVFHAGDYLAARHADLPDLKFLDEIPIRFGMAEERHYHVPLLLSPFGYTTYRGS